MGNIKLRIGNDRKINWKIMRNGLPEDFRGRELSVKMMHTFSGVEAKVSFTIENNVLHIVWLGKDQLKCGDYSLILIENNGRPDMFTLDHCEDITLVNRNQCENELISETSEIEVTSTINAPASGLSAYEIAKANGFIGSEKEWLESLKGAKGDDGDDGNDGVDGSILYPKYSVNSKMELEVESTVPTDRVMYDQATGELILNI